VEIKPGPVAYLGAGKQGQICYHCLYMGSPERDKLSAAEQPDGAAEVTWLQANRIALLAIARDRFAEYGRGALVIAAGVKPLDEETPLAYAPRDHIETQPDEVSRQLGTIVAAYDPDRQFVAVFVHPGDEFAFSMYQIRVG
jgi:hypothetical protein